MSRPPKIREGEKECRTCNTWKPLSTFYTNGKENAFKPSCKECFKKLNFTPVDEPKKCSTCKLIKESKEFSKCKSNIDGLQKICKTCRRNIDIKIKYNINQQQYEDMLKSQNSSCKICKVNQKNLKKKFAVDHNHKTGEVRGLLCYTCNYGLGYFYDSVELLRNAIDYLEST
jgi:hypothetical protein